MKNGLWIFLLLIFISACKNDRKISLTNTGSFSRADEPVVIISQFLDSIFGKDVTRFFPLVISGQGDTIPSQTDDFDKDGKWDELFLLCDFGPFEKKEVQLLLINPSHKPAFTKRANLRFARVVERNKKYEVISQAKRLKSTATELSQAAFQMEGPAWESDRVAFRNYFDARNGIDIYGKVTTKMVLDSIGTGENYHNLQWWGMDILHVGNSLGAGAIGIMAEDSLFRLDLPESGGFEPVAYGPLRIVFRLTYNSWQIKNVNYNLIHEISTWGGLYGYQSKIIISGTKEPTRLISGIVNIHSDSLYVNNSNATYTAIFTHDRQAENGACLGMGLILPNKNYSACSKAPIQGAGIIQTYFAQLNAFPDKPVIFRFYAGWQNSNSEFSTAAQFDKFLVRETERLSKPILIKAE
jgi:hypothetical protein